MGWLTVLLGLATCLVWFMVDHFTTERKKRRARAMCSPECACPGPAVAYLGWSGTINSFNLASTPFAFDFMLANRPRLVNVDYGVLSQLEVYARQLAAAATVTNGALSSAPLPASSPADAEEKLFLDAVKKLESLRGPASRRTHVEATLGKISMPAVRDRLLLEASRIEVQAVLEKVDSLKTPAAKKRHLQAALDGIRNDPVPNELQAREIEWLEEALRELE